MLQDKTAEERKLRKLKSGKHTLRSLNSHMPLGTMRFTTDHSEEAQPAKVRAWRM
jgi:hypothetical protein